MFKIRDLELDKFNLFPTSAVTCLTLNKILNFSRHFLLFIAICSIDHIV